MDEETMDQQRCEQLIAAIKQQGLPGSTAGLPLVSLEDFFGGNSVYFRGSTVAEIETWVADLEATDGAEGYEYSSPTAVPSLLPNMKTFSVWWD